ncbi:hypothetical protein F4775DRAFT_158960 [Biscogniauxia sp. FL1348]|nr:hypothetical protein F4775DRAFT_158960 [Biscogniauxia sp. FL1348]
MERRPSSRQTASSSSSIPQLPPLNLPSVELQSRLSPWAASGDSSPTDLRAQRLSWLMLEDSLPSSILGQLAPWVLRSPESLPEFSESPSRASLTEETPSREQQASAGVLWLRENQPLGEEESSLPAMSEQPSGQSSQSSTRDGQVLPTMTEPPSFPQFNITPPYMTPEARRSLATLIGEPPREVLRQQDVTELATMPERRSQQGEEYGSRKVSSSTEVDTGPKEGEESGDYIDGFKLGAVLISTTIVFFLLLLDNSIISTVRKDIFYPHSTRVIVLNVHKANSHRLYHRSRATFTVWKMLAGMVAHISFQGAFPASPPPKH